MDWGQIVSGLASAAAITISLLALLRSRKSEEEIRKRLTWEGKAELRAEPQSHRTMSGANHDLWFVNYGPAEATLRKLEFTCEGGTVRPSTLLRGPLTIAKGARIGHYHYEVVGIQPLALTWEWSDGNGIHNGEIELAQPDQPPNPLARPS